MPSEEEYQKAIEELKKEIDRDAPPPGASESMGGSLMGASGQQNLIEWQLDISKELAEIEHLLRGDRIEIDKEGNEMWKPPKTEEEALFNERGVQEILKIIRMYLNKNILLSNFSDEQIMQRVSQFGHRLRRFIFLNYEEFGLDTEYKQKHYEMIVMNVIDMVEASYWRAYNGGERDSLRTARNVTQTDPMDRGGYGQPMMSQLDNKNKGWRKWIPGM